MGSTPDYAIIAAPRISAAGFAAILRAGLSPAAGEAAACYRALDVAGVDPAVGLAIFRKESSFGRYGRAAANKSWGNIREPSGAFRVYPSWTAGAIDIARLLVIYGQNRIRPGTTTSSVQTLPFVWAPSADGNAPDAYGDSLALWIGQWSKQYPVGGGTLHATAVVTEPTPLWNGQTKKWVFNGVNRIKAGARLLVRTSRQNVDGVSCYPVSSPYPGYYVPATKVRLGPSS